MRRRAGLVILGLLAAACAAPARDHGESDDVKAVEAGDPAAAKAAAVEEQEKAAAAEKQKAAEKAAAAKKEKYAAKAGYGDAGSIEDRLARIEKLLVALTDQTHARAAKDKAAHHEHAKKEKAAAGEAGKDKAAWSADAQAQQEATQAKLVEVKHWLRLVEAERDELKARVKALEAENAALRPKAEPTK